MPIKELVTLEDFKIWKDQINQSFESLKQQIKRIESGKYEWKYSDTDKSKQTNNNTILIEQITFKKSYDDIPLINLSLNGVDLWGAKNSGVHFNIFPDNITKEGFSIKSKGWANCTVVGAQIIWIAITN